MKTNLLKWNLDVTKSYNGTSTMQETKLIDHKCTLPYLFSLIRIFVTAS